MYRYFFIIIITILTPFQLIKLYSNTNPSQGTVAGLKSQSSGEITNSISIGDFYFNLDGYTSPFAVVTLDGQGIFDKTVSDKNGYFKFANRFSPFSPREACLSSKDQFGRITASICLPPFPTRYNVDIGPVILPPTISLDKSVYYIDDQVVLSGQTMPNSPVKLSMFINNQSIIPNISLIKSVNAASFNDLTTKSDHKGNYSFSLSSSVAQNYKIFSQSQLEKSSSPNSNKLTFKVHPIWMIIFKFFEYIFSLIKPRLMEIAIALELIIISYFAYSQFIHHGQRAIVLRNHYDIALKEHREIIKI